MGNFKSPLSFSTDDIYLQAKTDIENNVVINVDDSNSLNPTVNVLLSIPVKDINKILYGKDGCVDCGKNLKSSTLKNIFDSIKRKIKERNEGPIIIDMKLNLDDNGYVVGESHLNLNHSSYIFPSLLNTNN